MIMSIILAAGEGTRMKSKTPKVVHRICGKPLISYIIEASQNTGSDKNIIIVGKNKGKIIEIIEDNSYKSVKLIEQPIGEEVPYGTGYAVMQAQNEINDEDTVMILNGDTPLIKDNTLKQFLSYHKQEKNDVTILTAEIDNPTGYGRIIRCDDKHTVAAIVEEKDANVDQKKIKEINSGIYCFKGNYLKKALNNLSNDNAQNEYYLTDAIKIFKKIGCKIGAYNINDNTEIMGVNTRVQLAEVESVMRKRINEEIMLSGVTIVDPMSTYIDNDVRIGRDTIVYPGVSIQGNTVIGEECIIGNNCRIVDSKIGDNVKVQISTIVESEINDNTTIGPYAYLRPKSKVGSNVKIGDFVEIKNASIGDFSKASHLAYIGDAEVGERVNIGCGVVFVNYDGKNKYKSIVKDDAFVGSNCNLVAPVIIEEKAFLAAGSTITDDVEAYALSIARARQVNKSGWVKAKKK
ncbi:bifunctional UDP-N-acetylglucosamine diphosphorylase/glucosamine-1-phosphate N-acetyltransferase GlmU [Abyssisolibacter fermentans]|uniref:bifunctional UDP-N-acetylglucosamine diphosphorylase/glucosamine-1-phosphate N-acetyltransferase GlmU n=1 Tax=Abyssisolibacter fermentans TaxID=1766203 RepID=UPI000831D60D|nr:bifunctional UDP-N-acetylglucosamine diphosphorylase/glucosamine-1-phosphate N-acetyltransferase GlmU [Abyssisolibacter fermentans]